MLRKAARRHNSQQPGPTIATITLTERRIATTFRFKIQQEYKRFSLKQELQNNSTLASSKQEGKSMKYYQVSSGYIYYEKFPLKY